MVEGRDIRRGIAASGALIFIILLTLAPLLVSRYTAITMSNVFLYVVLTVCWASFCGPTHYISLASAAFFGAGIYAAATLGDKLPWPLVVVAGGLLSFVLAFLVGLSSLRLRGMYFTIFTFGLSELIRLAVHWWEVNVTGTVGRLVVAVADTTVYYAMLTIAVLTVVLAYALGKSKIGLALRAVGDTENAADHVGINVTAVKIFAFALTSALMGCAGAVMATRWTYIDPSIAFNPLYSFMPVLMAIFGGASRIRGQIIGAVTLTLLADLLLTKFPYYYNLMYGVILVVVIMYLPEGLAVLPDKLRRRRTSGRDK